MKHPYFLILACCFGQASLHQNDLKQIDSIAQVETFAYPVFSTAEPGVQCRASAHFGGFGLARQDDLG